MPAVRIINETFSLFFEFGLRREKKNAKWKLIPKAIGIVYEIRAFVADINT